MDLRVARDCEVGAFGSIASITWHPNAQRGIPPGEIRARRLRSGASLVFHLALQVSWRPWFRPRKRNIWTVRRPRMTAGNHSRPRWMRGDYAWSRMRIEWRCWIQAPRPMWYTFVGLRTIHTFWRGRGAGRYRPVRQPHAFAMELAVLVKYVTQRTFR